MRYIVRLLELAERHGEEPARLLAAAGMDAISDDQPDVRVPTEAYYRLWATAMAALEDPAFPLKLAGSMDSASFDALGFAVVTSATYGDALERIQRYLPFVTDGASWTIDRHHHIASLTFTQRGERSPEHRFVDEFSLAHLVIVGRNLTTTAWQLEEVHFVHPRPPQIGALEEFFKAPLIFDAETTQLRLPRAVLELPFAKANPHMAAFFDRHIESVLERSHPEHDFVTSVRRLLGESLLRGCYSLEEVAKRLALSPRTLRRRLSKEGVAFSALLEAVRRDLAEQYLRERQMSLGEIAFALGYSEPATFYRAFRRWHGVTPAAYRTAHRPSLVGPQNV